jgi:hypothetical protein
MAYLNRLANFYRANSQEGMASTDTFDGTVKGLQGQYVRNGSNWSASIYVRPIRPGPCGGDAAFFSKIAVQGQRRG